MARNNQKQTTTFQAAVAKFLPWHVTQRGEKSFWNKVGAAWRHKDGHGYTIQLEVVPINGRIVLRQPVGAPSSLKVAEGAYGGLRITANADKGFDA